MVFLAQSNCEQIWDPLGGQVNSCIQVKHSLKIGWGPMYELCWGDAGASFLLLVLEPALAEQCRYSLRDFLAQLGGGSGTV